MKNYLTASKQPTTWDKPELDATQPQAAASDEQEMAADASQGLRMISIRLPDSLIEDYKNIATIRHGSKGYQTLMRQVLARYASDALKDIARDMAAQIQSGKIPLGAIN